VRSTCMGEEEEEDEGELEVEEDIAMVRERREE
jgi:hypothetical protein